MYTKIFLDETSQVHSYQISFSLRWSLLHGSEQLKASLIPNLSLSRSAHPKKLSHNQRHLTAWIKSTAISRFLKAILCWHSAESCTGNLDFLLESGLTKFLSMICILNILRQIYFTQDFE